MIGKNGYNCITMKKRIAPLFLLFWALIQISCNTHLQNERTTVSSVRIDSCITPDSHIDSLIKPYRQVLESTMDEIIGYSDVAMDKGKPEGLLNNFVCDAILSYVNERISDSSEIRADMILLNSGGLRSSLPLGPITRGDIFRLMPFDNELVIITIPAERINSMVQFIIAKGGMPVSGFELVIHDTIASSVIINSKDPSSYTNISILTSDYLAEGGDNMTFFFNPIRIENTGITVRDAIMNYILAEMEAKRTLMPKLDGRIRYE